MDLRQARASLVAQTRDGIIEAAADILRDEGPAALSVRRVAQRVNSLTKTIYTCFGGKDGLLDVLYRQSFAALQAAMDRASGASPEFRLVASWSPCALAAARARRASSKPPDPDCDGNRE